jgi:hypothetical protein
MAVLVIPTFTDPLYTQRTILDGKEYLFTFDWQDRSERWYLSIHSINEEPLILGIKIVANWPLLRKFPKDGRIPAGELVAVDFAESGEPPGLLELGTRVQLHYYEEGTPVDETLGQLIPAS